MYALSSDFQLAAEAQNATWSRQFFFGAVDYASYVTRWPSIDKTWNSLNPQTVTVELNDTTRILSNLLFNWPPNVRVPCRLFLAPLTFSTSAALMYQGTIDSAQFRDGKCTLTLIDKFRILTDRKAGDSSSPCDYTGSSYLIHDMAWYACTSLGGLSAVASSSNTDIDYTSWSSWASCFSADNTRCKAYLTGQTPLEVLRKLAALTQSAIYVESNKLKFTRFTQTAEDYRTLDDARVLDTVATFDDRQVINKSWVSAAYDTTSRTFGITVFDQSTASQASYGLREVLTAEEVVWLTDSVSALNLAQRQVLGYKELTPQFSVRTPMHTIGMTIGDPIRFSDSLLLVDDTYRIMGETLDMDAGTKTFKLERTQFFSSFMLDISALDSSDVLL